MYFFALFISIPLIAKSTRIDKINVDLNLERNIQSMTLTTHVHNVLAFISVFSNKDFAADVFRQIFYEMSGRNTTNFVVDSRQNPPLPLEKANRRVRNRKLEERD